MGGDSQRKRRRKRIGEERVEGGGDTTRESPSSEVMVVTSRNLRSRGAREKEEKHLVQHAYQITVYLR